MTACSFVSGEIPRVTPYERGLPGQVRLMEDGQTWEVDELLIDERFLAVNVAGKGLVVFSACSHAGVVNVLTHARASFPGANQRNTPKAPPTPQTSPVRRVSAMARPLAECSITQNQPAPPAF